MKDRKREVERAERKEMTGGKKKAKLHRLYERKKVI
jgi:hypothetical protein